MSTIRTPEPFWKTTGPKAPWGDFDPNAKLNFSFDLSPWVATAGAGLTVSAYEVSADPLLHVNSQLAGSVVTVQVRAADGATLVSSASLWLRLHMTLGDGQWDDRTFWLELGVGWRTRQHDGTLQGRLLRFRFESAMFIIFQQIICALIWMPNPWLSL